MEFKIERHEKQNLDRFPKEHIDIAYDFATRGYKEFGTFIKAIVLFGSVTRKAEDVGDIDILIIIDDLSLTLKPEVIQTYRILVQKLIADISTKLHITTLKLTTFFEYAKAGDPVAINILRDGVALLDTGFFEPLQLLLRTGRIRPTPEAVWSYYVRAPATIQNAKWHVLQASLDLYWAVIDAAHAALMKANQIPPTPEHVADLLEDVFVKTKRLSPKYVATMRNFYKLSKDITHRSIKDITGQQYDRYLRDAQDFVNEMKLIVEGKKGF